MSPLCRGVPKERFHCNKKFNVQVQPHLSRIKHVFLFPCSVVTGLPTTTKVPPPSLKWVRGKQVGGVAYIPGEWKLTLSDHSTIEETVAFIQGALKEIDEEGVMEVEVCEDFLYIMFNPLHQILFILYKCEIHMFRPFAAQNINLKQEKCHTLPHQSLSMSNKPTFYLIISNMFVFE